MFRIMSYREMVEFDQCDECEKKIDDYLCKFIICLGVVVEIFALSNVYFCLFVWRMVPMNVIERKDRHAKSERIHYVG